MMRGTAWERVAVLGVLVIAGCGGAIDDGLFGDADAGGAGRGGDGGAEGGGIVQCQAYPSCNAGDTARRSRSDACGSLASSCYSRSLCGTTIWCSHEEATCTAVPVCPNGYLEAPQCIDASCVTVTVCGATIRCEPEAVLCEGPKPICDAGDVEVASEKECVADGACYWRANRCGYGIWCTGPRAEDGGAASP